MHAPTTLMKTKTKKRRKRPCSATCFDKASNKPIRKGFIACDPKPKVKKDGDGRSDLPLCEDFLFV